LLAVPSAASRWIAATAFGLRFRMDRASKDATLAAFAEQLLLIHWVGFLGVAEVHYSTTPAIFVFEYWWF
jgi:hypothetical protein